jgi:hypothetical protein
MRLKLINCHNDGTSAENMEGITLSRGHGELYSLVQFTLIKKKIVEYIIPYGQHLKSGTHIVIASK